MGASRIFRLAVEASLINAVAGRLSRVVKKGGTTDYDDADVENAVARGRRQVARRIKCASFPIAAKIRVYPDDRLFEALGCAVA